MDREWLSEHSLHVGTFEFRFCGIGELSANEICYALMYAYPNLRPSDAFKWVRRLFSEVRNVSQAVAPVHSPALILNMGQVDTDNDRQISFEE